MGAIEVVLIILGMVVFIVSFLLPAGKSGGGQEAPAVKEEDIQKMLEKEVTGVRTQISEIADETINYSMEKTERSMERLTNEKMMAINEYSDTVLSEINKNHKEVVFLYDMLNDKHENLLSTVSEASKTASEIKQAVSDVEVSAKEAQEKIRRVQESVSEVMDVQSRLSEISAAEKASSFVPVMETEDEENVFRPMMPQRVELSGETSDDYILADGEEADNTEFSDDASAWTESAKKKTRKPRAVKKEKSEKTGTGEETAVGKAMLSSAEVPEIAVGVHSPQQGGRNNNERILELHRAGKSNVAIAKELGLGIGEVKLVIGLFEGI